jgi:uncharacterized protein YqeY
MSLSGQIHFDMVEAMRSGHALQLGVLRMVKTAIKNKEVEIGETLSDEAVESVLNTQVKQRRDSATQFRKGGRDELAEKEEAEIGFIERYLPAPATEDEIREAIAAAIAETGAESMKQMGAVMKATMAGLTGKTVDGGRVSGLVREALGGR